MSPHSRRRLPGTRTPAGSRARSGDRTVPAPIALTASLAVAALTALGGPVAAAAPSSSDSTGDGSIVATSLGSSGSLSGSVTGSLGSLDSPVYTEYVALGDSYAAFGDQTEPAGFVPAGCQQSLTNYPKVLGGSPFIAELVDVTCGGATIADLAGAQSVSTPPGTAAPQFDALTPDTDLVTLSIGGNDVGFSTIVGCITRQGPFASLPADQTCEALLGTDIDAAIAGVFGAGGPIDSVYETIGERSPDAKVIATRYLPLMPPAGTSCAFTDQLNPADVAWSREVTTEINTAVDAAATRNGHVSVLPVDPAGDHSACAAPAERWTSFLGTPDNAAPFHPTTLGQVAMAVAVAAEL